MIELAPQHKRGLSLTNPVLNASGVLGFSGEYRGPVNFSALGAFVTTALTAAPRRPAQPPNVVELPNGVLIHTGLPNPGVNAAVRRYARDWSRLDCPVIVHLAATSAGEVRRSVERLERVAAVSGLELGLRDEVEPSDMAVLIRAAVGSLPLVVRLPLLRAVELCAAAVQAGADALTVGAPPRHTIQVAGRTISGRLYSPDVFPQALESVRQVAACVGGTALVIGAGGVYTVEQVCAMLAAGAVAVQVDGAVWSLGGKVLEQMAEAVER